MKNLGDFRLTRLNPDLSYSSTGGHETHETWRGLYTDCLKSIPTLTAEKVDWNIAKEVDSPMGVLTFSRGNLSDGTVEEDNLEDIWSRRGNLSELDIFAHPNSIAIETAKPGALRAIDQAVKGFASNPTTNNVPQASEIIPNADSGIRNLAQALISFLIGGGTHYPITQPVVRNTRLVSHQSSFVPPVTDGRTVYTTAKLIANNVSMPAWLKDSLETGFWHQQPADRVQTARGKYQVNVEWWFYNNVSAFVYNIID